ncbi:hypothetical protein Tco_0380926, partial [Tanacetum coccineum]
EDGICGERQTGGDELVAYRPTQQRASYEVLADIQMDYSHPKKFGYQKDNQAESNSGRKSNNSSVEAKSTSRNASAFVSKLGLRMKGKMKANDHENIVEAHITPLNLVDPMSDDLTVVATTHGQHVLSFYPEDRSCNVFEDAMSRCSENGPQSMLAGQRCFTLLIE